MAASEGIAGRGDMTAEQARFNLSGRMRFFGDVEKLLQIWSTIG